MTFALRYKLKRHSATCLGTLAGYCASGVRRSSSTAKSFKDTKRGLHIKKLWLGMCGLKCVWIPSGGNISPVHIYQAVFRNLYSTWWRISLQVPNTDNQEEVIDLVGTTPTQDEPQESTPTTWVRAYPCQGQDNSELLEPRRKRQHTQGETSAGWNHWFHTPRQPTGCHGSEVRNTEQKGSGNCRKTD